MIVLKENVFKAQLMDLGYSGSIREPTFVGYFTREDIAVKAARISHGPKLSSITGVRPEVVPYEFSIEIYEDLDEFTRTEEDALIASAKKKLTIEEFNALVKRISTENS